MFKRIQGLLAGIVIGALLASGVMVAYAAGNTRQLDAFFNNIKVVLDGKELQLVDGNGKTVEPFIVDGSNYLPVGIVARALGKAVYWDGKNYTVYIGAMDGQLEYPTAKIADVTNIAGRKAAITTSPANLVDNYGNRYATAMQFANNYNFVDTAFRALLDMKYTHLKGTLYVGKDTSFAGVGTVTITLDGNIVYTSPEINKATKPIAIDIDVTGANDIQIYSSASGTFTYIYLGDAGFYQ